MRGIDTTQSAMFSYVSPEQRVPKDHPLRTIRPLCDVALKALSREFDRVYSDVGRPSIAPEKLLRALLLQILYTMRGCSFKLWSKKRE
jgi:transposase